MRAKKSYLKPFENSSGMFRLDIWAFLEAWHANPEFVWQAVVTM